MSDYDIRPRRDISNTPDLDLKPEDFYSCPEEVKDLMADLGPYIMAAAILWSREYDRTPDHKKEAVSEFDRTWIANEAVQLRWDAEQAAEDESRAMAVYREQMRREKSKTVIDRKERGDLI